MSTEKNHTQPPPDNKTGDNTDDVAIKAEKKNRPRKVESDAAQDRIAEALRANLRRRKTQARDRNNQS